jgi:hypothetical protein
LICTIQIKKENNVDDAEWKKLKEGFNDVKNYLDEAIKNKKTGYGNERLKQLEDKLLKEGARESLYGRLVWHGVIVRFSELHRTKKKKKEDVVVKPVLPDFIRERVGQEILGEKWGRKDRLYQDNKLIPGLDGGWYGRIKYGSDLLVRVSVARNGLGPENPKWRSLHRSGEILTQKIFDRMLEKSGVFGEEWLKQIKVWLAGELGAKAMVVGKFGEFEWNGLVVWFPALKGVK